MKLPDLERVRVELPEWGIPEAYVHELNGREMDRLSDHQVSVAETGANPQIGFRTFLVRVTLRLGDGSPAVPDDKAAEFDERAGGRVLNRCYYTAVRLNGLDQEGADPGEGSIQTLPSGGGIG